MEATGHARWFERLLAEPNYELWIGDPARIKAARVRKQKTDRQDAQLLLKLLEEERFPRIWVPSPENRDLRHRRIAKVAMARRLAISLYWMWRKGYARPQTLQFGSHAGEPGFVHWCEVDHRPLD